MTAEGTDLTRLLTDEPARKRHKAAADAGSPGGLRQGKCSPFSHENRALEIPDRPQSPSPPLHNGQAPLLDHGVGTNGLPGATGPLQPRSEQGAATHPQEQAAAAMELRSAPSASPFAQQDTAGLNISSARPANGARRGEGKMNRLLSFSDELDGEEEGSGPPYSSLSESTARRFETERELVVLNPAPEGTSPRFRPADTGSTVASQDRSSLTHSYFGLAQARGMRPYMEDRTTIVSSFVPLSSSGQPLPDGISRSFAAVYDGHNGAQAADHASSRLHQVLAQDPVLRTCTGSGPPAMANAELRNMTAAVTRAFETLDREILNRARAESGRDGTTALVFVRVGEVVWAAHAGDSRAVMNRDGQALRLTRDHKPDLAEEKARVESAGGRVDFQRCWRVICPARNGRPASGLAVSRSFGDLDFKEPDEYVTCQPEMGRFQLDSRDSFVIMASDGLWDVMADQEAVNIAQEALQAHAAKEGSWRATYEAAKFAADRLVAMGLEKKSMDNITALVILFQWD